MKQNTESTKLSGRLPALRMGDVCIDPPIIQGGMGVRVSASRLASAVSREGALGVVASVGTGEEWPDRSVDYATRSYLSLREMLGETRSNTSNPVGVNIMCALTNYDRLVRAAMEEKVDVIISGAGLPLKLPSLVPEGTAKLLPIVSSGRAAGLLCKTWLRKHSRLPDGFVVEGPLAGGHIGFRMLDLNDQDQVPLETLVKDVLEVCRPYEDAAGRRLPVIAAGGVFSGRDIALLLDLGASGVQMGTRFVCTHECDAAIEYKRAYLSCSPEDILLIESPVGLPIRVIRNPFVDRVLSGERIDFTCAYRCLATCRPRESRYCIAQALINAYRGNLDAGFTTCGSNACRIKSIVSVHELLAELVDDACRAMGLPYGERTPD